MKYVQLLAHWVKGDKQKASASATTFRNDDLFSYRTLIGRIVRDIDGNRVAIISDDKWSDSTTMIQNAAARAASDACMASFRVPDLNGNHSANLAAYQAKAEAALDGLERGLLRSAPSYRGQARAIIATAANYANTFGIEWAYSGRNPDDVKHKGELA